MSTADEGNKVVFLSDGAGAKPPATASMDGVIGRLEKNIPAPVRPMLVDDEKSLSALRKTTGEQREAIQKMGGEIMALRAELAKAQQPTVVEKAPCDQTTFDTMKEQINTLSTEVAMISRVFSALPFAQGGKSLSVIALELVAQFRHAMRQLDSIDLIQKSVVRK